METRKRQRSVSQPKVHPVGEGGSTQILQQAGCKQDDTVDVEGCLHEQNFTIVKVNICDFDNILFVVHACLHQGQGSQGSDENRNPQCHLPTG